MADVVHKGGCHCGRVTFQVLAPAILHCIKCNCTICEKKQNIHFIVPCSKFTLMSGKEALTTYTFNTHMAKHTFCKVCGVQGFYTPRSNPDGIGVMPHCLDSETVEKVIIEIFDGSNWESTMKSEQGKKVKEFSAS